jgi:hypothetical protein
MSIGPAKRKPDVNFTRDGRFIANNDETVLDTKTNLMWAAKDKGSAMNWANAKRYCENYRGAGYTDWRMPTQDELDALYLSGAARGTPDVPIKLPNNSSVWASETSGSNAAYVVFGFQFRFMGPKSMEYNRALPVRSVNRLLATVKRWGNLFQ